MTRASNEFAAVARAVPIRDVDGTIEARSASCRDNPVIADREILEAALAGLQSELSRLDQAADLPGESRQEHGFD
jgi:hypothetical protein